jgi:hypothetical protein
VTEIQQKLGDSLSWAVVLKDDVTGLPINLTGGTVEVEFRGLNGGGLITPVVTVLDQGTNPGEFTVVVADGEVFRDSPKSLFADIQFVLNGLTTSSDTFKIILVRDITL